MKKILFIFIAGLIITGSVFPTITFAERHPEATSIKIISEIVNK